MSTHPELQRLRRELIEKQYDLGSVTLNNAFDAWLNKLDTLNPEEQARVVHPLSYLSKYLEALYAEPTSYQDCNQARIRLEVSVNANMGHGSECIKNLGISLLVLSTLILLVAATALFLSLLLPTVSVVLPAIVTAPTLAGSLVTGAIGLFGIFKGETSRTELYKSTNQLANDITTAKLPSPPSPVNSLV